MRHVEGHVSIRDIGTMVAKFGKSGELEVHGKKLILYLRGFHRTYVTMEVAYDLRYVAYRLATQFETTQSLARTSAKYARASCSE